MFIASSATRFVSAPMSSALFQPLLISICFSKSVAAQATQRCITAVIYVLSRICITPVTCIANGDVAGGICNRGV